MNAPARRRLIDMSGDEQRAQGEAIAAEIGHNSGEPEAFVPPQPEQARPSTRDRAYAQQTAAVVDVLTAQTTTLIAGLRKAADEYEQHMLQSAAHVRTVIESHVTNGEQIQAELRTLIDSLDQRRKAHDELVNARV